MRAPPRAVQAALYLALHSPMSTRATAPRPPPSTAGSVVLLLRQLFDVVLGSRAKHKIMPRVVSAAAARCWRVSQPRAPSARTLGLGQILICFFIKVSLILIHKAFPTLPNTRTAQGLLSDVFGMCGRARVTRPRPGPNSCVPAGARHAAGRAHAGGAAAERQGLGRLPYARAHVTRGADGLALRSRAAR